MGKYFKTQCQCLTVESSTPCCFHVSNIFQVGHFDQEISPKANYPDYLTLCERYFALLLLHSLKYFTSTAA